MSERGAEPGFRGPQVCKIVGITYRQLDYWARTDLVRPSINDAKGSGTQRTYSFQDLVRLKVDVLLVAGQQGLDAARRAGSGTPAYPLLNHLVRPLQERRRDRQAESLGRRGA